MKALVLQGIKDLAVQEYDVPEIKSDEVLIHTAYAGICGTDKALYAGLPGSASAVPPIVLGSIYFNSPVLFSIAYWHIIPIPTAFESRIYRKEALIAGVHSSPNIKVIWQ